MSAMGGLVCVWAVGGGCGVAGVPAGVKTGAMAECRPTAATNTGEFDICAVVIDAAVNGGNGGSCEQYARSLAVNCNFRPLDERPWSLQS